MGCPGQLTRTTTIPHDPLDILQAQEQVRHRGGDRRAHRGSNPGGGAEQVHDGPQQLDPHVLGTHESSNQGIQAGQSLPRPLSYRHLYITLDQEVAGLPVPLSLVVRHASSIILNDD